MKHPSKSTGHILFNNFMLLIFFLCFSSSLLKQWVATAPCCFHCVNVAALLFCFIILSANYPKLFYDTRDTLERINTCYQKLAHKLHPTCLWHSVLPIQIVNVDRKNFSRASRKSSNIIGPMFQIMTYKRFLYPVIRKR